MLETMAAALTGSQFGFEASSFLTTEGEPPRVGQLFVVLHPQRLGGPGFLGRLEILLSAVLGQAGTDLPAEPRLTARQRARTDGIPVDADLLADLHRRAGRG
jgi:(2R)-3-sulfolactate dehydrogenase (NADP+)